MKFGRDKSEPQAASPARGVPSPGLETRIGPNAHIRGDIVSEGGIRVEGIFEGNIETTGNLVIAESAKIIAEIKANNVSISGAIKGNITGNRVEILATGRVWGDLTINSLLLNEGAYLRGHTTMHADIEPPQLEPPRPQAHPTSGASQADTIVDVQPLPRQGDEPQRDY